jgi:ABC-type transporter Mla MlaB component
MKTSELKEEAGLKIKRNGPGRRDCNMCAEKLDQAIHISLSGPLDESAALGALRFLNLHASEKQVIVVDLEECFQAHSHSYGMAMLKKGLQCLFDRGHPIFDHASGRPIFRDK